MKFSLRKNIKYSALLILLVFTSLKICAQSETQPPYDSIEIIYKGNNTDSAKLFQICSLTKRYNYDSKFLYTAFYSIVNLIESPHITDYAITASKVLSLYSEDYQAQNTLSEILVTKITNLDKKLYLQSQISYNLSLRGNHGEALKLIQQVLTEIEEINTKYASEIYLYAAFVYRNWEIGQAHEKTDFSKVKKLFQKVILTSDSVKQRITYSTAIREIGNLHFLTGQYDSSLYYQKKAIEIASNSPEIYLGYYYHDMSITYRKMGNFEQMLVSQKRAYQESQKYSDYNGEILSLCSLSESYITLNQKDSAIIFINRAEELVEKQNLKPMYQQVFLTKSYILRLIGDFQNALAYFETASFYKDSLYNEERTKQIDILNIKFDVANKDKELIKNQQKIKQQRIIIISVIIGFVLIIVFSVVLLKFYKKIVQTNQQLQMQNQQILLQKEEIGAQRDEIEAQRDEIFEKNQHITSSIEYARKIQLAMLPSKELLSRLFNQYFLFYNPKDIVSGDFYWVKVIDDIIFVAVADCTGHGVPGAFVSMMGISMLNDIVGRREIKQTNQILESLRSEIKSSLQQTGKDSEQKDGMDISLCAIDKAQLKLQYSGAYNSIYIGRNNLITELHADRQPIGIYINEKPFTYQDFMLQNNDFIYMFSDGYKDQFSSNKSEKFKSKRFKSMFESIMSKTAENQKETVHNTFFEWKASTPQTDDVLVLGIKIEDNQDNI